MKPTLQQDLLLGIQNGPPDGSISNTAIVAVPPTPRLISGQLSARDIQSVIDWLKLNEAALVERCERCISGVELAHRLQRL
jgi:hypothetical protein